MAFPKSFAVKQLLERAILRGLLPDHDYLFNHLVNRIPLAGPRMLAYAALGVDFDDVTRSNVSLGVEMWVGRNLSIGAGSTIGQRCYIDARAGIRIDENVSVSREACLLTASHDPDSPDFEAPLAPVHLESRSWVATRAMVLPGVRVGEGSVVAAGAVVVDDVEPYTVVGGVPARVIRQRRRPLAYELDFRPSWY